MSRNKIEITVGIVVLLLPFLGFPPLIDKFILIFAGLVLCVSSLLAHVQAKSAPVIRKQREISG